MSISLDIKVGDIVLGGKFKNKRIEVKTIGTDELGQPTINGKSILKIRIEKLLPKEKQSKETRETVKEVKKFPSLKETYYTSDSDQTERINRIIKLFDEGNDDVAAKLLHEWIKTGKISLKALKALFKALLTTRG